ncbi:E3 ubiquitin ligase complex SCF subunit sconC [Neoconidiobolus thromboides FSU 785]|nr:E3 ubiquitin ligase complex SCF subunit sconC [Neoconidiobolus thromboides FSU 785]
MIIKLKSSEGTEFSVDREIITRSILIRNILEDVEACDTYEIPLPNVSAPILTKIIEYCTHHKDEPISQYEEGGNNNLDEIDAWDQEFCKVDQGTLYDLILAANYLDVRSLLDLTCKIIANMIKNKTPEQIRQTFNIENDFTPEEEEKNRRENAWVDDR